MFGATINVDARDVQYYIYAENANSGIFSPDALIKTLDDHYEGRTNDGPFLWSLSVFNRFLNKSKSELIL